MENIKQYRYIIMSIIFGIGLIYRMGFEMKLIEMFLYVSVIKLLYTGVKKEYLLYNRKK